MKIDKVVVTNFGALAAKYKTEGLAKIQSALNALVASDQMRGLVTTVIGVDDATGMKTVSAPPVTNAEDPRQNKDAIDGIYRALGPDYLVILGSVDIVPHVDLLNPMYDSASGADPDKNASGDLPYACEAQYSQNPQDFLGPTRVVSRLPDLTGIADTAYLIGLLETARSYKTFPLDEYHSYFGISAEIWKGSTTLSVTHVFGASSELKLVPPETQAWPPPFFARKAHFINCHGATASPQFYGQPSGGAQSYPIALDAAYLTGKVSEGTIAAAECCYGAELYDPKLANNEAGICSTYLSNKAYGFWGSTTVAYGPAESNAQADLICQYFLQSVLQGASLGRAALEARQKFVQTASPPDPSDVKTLAQFNLYGDASITPVAVPSSAVGAVPNDIGPINSMAKTVSFVTAQRVEREDRRKMLFRTGMNLAASEPRVTRSRVGPRISVESRLRERARELGITPESILSFDIVPRRVFSTSLPKTMRVSKSSRARFHVVFGGRQESGAERVIQVVAMVAKEVAGELVSVSRIESR